ncbi:DUF4362 domain-containing protein [Virgibacillus senegalensis]|uniref:DUF4362 domain-containing protein n=1 Tax=Virgibacillus senegalensis TaxID=1499679 RepID=UPI00069EE073|nr:DUF4362 domain-containing protein [Virgibacillus senegalensis]
MKKSLLLLLLPLALLAACSNAESEESYSVEDARENGDVIAQHQANSFDEIVQGAVEVENAEKLTQLITNVEENKEDEVNISVFDLDGSHSENKISYNGETITFENNYGNYEQSPAGTYECSYISQRGPVVYLSSCSAEDESEVSTMIGFVGTEEAFR